MLEERFQFEAHYEIDGIPYIYHMRWIQWVHDAVCFGKKSLMD